MEYIGTIRRMDNLGRLVIPKEFRKTMDLEPDTAVEICMTANKELLIKKPKNDDATYCPKCNKLLLGSSAVLTAQVGIQCTECNTTITI